MAEPTTVTLNATVKRNVGSSMSSCHGSPLYYVEGDTAGRYGIDVEQALGRSLGEGTKVLVTITVVDERPMPAADECINPWSGHAGRNAGDRAMVHPSWVGRHCVGHPEHDAAEGRSHGVGR